MCAAFETGSGEERYVYKDAWRNYLGILQDEVHVAQELVYNKHTGKLVGFTNLHTVSNELLRLDDFPKKRTSPQAC